MRRLLLIPLMSVIAGCGSNTPEIPDDLLKAIQGSNTTSPPDGEYPEGPYGSGVGDIAENTCFAEGWLNPKASNYDPADFEEICFADFYDPEGEIRLLLVNTGAVWCSACQVEWGGGGDGQPSFGEHHAERFDQGFRAIGSIFQDAKRDPATEVHAVAWAKNYEVDLPFALDPDFRMGKFADENIQPFNMLIDTTTMEIVLQVEGDQPAVLWTFVDERLAQ